MGYVPTTNYGFQKPEKTNAFNVDDLNNALDQVDAILKEKTDEAIDIAKLKVISFPINLVDGSTYEIYDDVGIFCQSGDWKNPVQFKSNNGNYVLKINTFGQQLEYNFELTETTTDEISDLFCKCNIQNIVNKVSVGDYYFTSSSKNDSLSIPRSSESISFSESLKYGDGSYAVESDTISIIPNQSQVDVIFNVTIPTKLITSSTNLLVPAGKYDVMVFGGGGGGGSEYESGGGGGGYMEQDIIELLSSEAVQITIGSGGSVGQNGRATSFGAYITANGGATCNAANGGNGGTGGGGGKKSGGNSGNGGKGSYGGGGGGASAGGYSGYGGDGGSGGTYGGGGGGGSGGAGGSSSNRGVGASGGTYGGKGGDGAYRNSSSWVNAKSGSNGRDTTALDLDFVGNGTGGIGATPSGNNGGGGGGGGGYGGNGGNGGTGGGGGGGGYGGNGGRGGGGGGGYGGDGGNGGDDGGGGGGGYGTQFNAGAGDGYGAGGSHTNAGVRGICIIKYVIE